MKRGRRDEVLDYWFGEIRDATEYYDARIPLWFGGAPETDADIRRRFEPDLRAAVRGELAAWEVEPRSSLALIVLLDQFSLNIDRDLARSFAQSALAVPIALRGIERGFDRRLAPVERVFHYLPLEHAEDVGLQRRSVELFAALRDEAPLAVRERFETFHWCAVEHWKVVDRFGRFPDRNAVLGRPHTPEEARYMAEGGPHF